MARHKILKTSIAVLALFGVACKELQPSFALPWQQASQTQPQKRFVFELWKERIVGGLGVHTFVAVHDYQKNNYLTIEGLATNRQTGDMQPVGQSETDDIVAYVQYSGSFPIRQDSHAIQKLGILYQTDDPMDLSYKLIDIVSSTVAINDAHYPYYLLGKTAYKDQTTYNSNSIANTVIHAGGLNASSITLNGFAPGWDQTISNPITRSNRLPNIVAVKSFLDEWEEEKANSSHNLTKTIDMDTNVSVGNLVSVREFLDEAFPQPRSMCDDFCGRKTPTYDPAG